jgi:hypothetical protein
VLELDPGARGLHVRHDPHAALERSFDVELAGAHERHGIHALERPRRGRWER